jgi:hypothetical protein
MGSAIASHLVDRLVPAKLVLWTEDPLDHRRMLAQLSPSGEELAELITGFVGVAFVFAFFVGNPRPRGGGQIME